MSVEMELDNIPSSSSTPSNSSSTPSSSRSISSELLEHLKNGEFWKFCMIFGSPQHKKNFDVNYFYGDPENGTLLDVACRTRDRSQFVQELLESGGVDVNAINKITNKAAIHEIVEYSDLETLQVLLEKSNCDVNIKDINGNTALHYAALFNRHDLIDTLANHGANSRLKNNNGDEPVTLALGTENYDKMLQMCCVSCPPMMQTIRNGHFRVLERQLRSKNVSYDPVAGKSPLLAVFDGVYALRNANHVENVIADVECGRNRWGFLKGIERNNTNSVHVGNEDFRSIINTLRSLELYPNEDRDHYACLKLILRLVPAEKLYIDYADIYGNTPLHYAVKWKLDKYAVALLQAGASVCAKNNLGIFPLTLMNAKTLREYLDSCISSDDQAPENDYFQVKFDCRMMTRNSCAGVKLFHDQHVRETEPLLVMNDVPELRVLLKHPLLRAYLNLKWYILRKYFWFNFLLYFLFCILLNAYIFFFYNSLHVEASDNNRTSDSVSSVFSVDDAVLFDAILRPIILALCLGIFIRELFQFILRPWSYCKSHENALEITIIFLTLAFLYHRTDPVVGPLLAAASILVSWFELLLLIGRHPKFSTNVEVFKTVAWNFFNFITLYSILILSFAFSFHILFKNKTENGEATVFSSLPMSVFKSIVMLTGEFDASSIPFNSQISFAHCFFIWFIFLVVIVLVNLLVGLAVGDTQAVRADAQIFGVVSRVKFIIYMESMAIGDRNWFFDFFNNLLKCCMKKCSSEVKFFHKFYDKITISRFLRDDCIVVLPNRDRRVLLDDLQSSRRWKIDCDIVRDALDILQKKAAQCTTRDFNDCYRLIEKCDDQLELHMQEMHQCKEQLKSHFDELIQCKEKLICMEKLLRQIMANQIVTPSGGNVTARSCPNFTGK